jgi:CelD/BcsL family acetyltransferase involved in cellulose biosynthesis
VPHRASGTSIKTIDEIDPAQWDDLISADPSSSPFHTREWLACLASAYPHWKVGAIVHSERGKITAALPFVRRRRSGVLLLESLPFGGYGGLIQADPRFDGEDLVAQFLSQAAGPLSVVRLVDGSGRSLDRWKGAVTSRTSTVLDISSGYEVASAQYRANVRKNLKHARDAQLVIEPVESQSSLEAFRKLAIYAYRLHMSTLPYPPALYESIARLLVPVGRATFELAYKDGMAVAGSLHLVGAHEMLNWLTPAYREFQELRANTLLIDHAIRSGVVAGLRRYDLGSSQGSEGLDRFKRAWGGYQREYEAIERASAPAALAGRLMAFVRRRGTSKVLRS